MPGKQTAPASKGASQSAARKPQQQAQPRGGSQGQAATGERDETYGVISVLYHALQGAETIAQYIRDARAADDEELAEFFEETRQAYVERAEEAKVLLASRLETSEDEDDEDEDEDEDEDDEDEDEDEE